MKSTNPRSDDKTIDKTVDVTKYIFRSPNPNISLFIFFLISILLGFILTFDVTNLSINFESEKLYTSIIVYGLIIIAVPTIITALTSGLLAESLGGRFYYRRSVLLVSVSVLLLGLIIFICKFITVFTKIEPVVILIFGYSALFALRHSALIATSHHSHSRSIPVALIQPVLGFIMILLLPQTGIQFNFGMMEVFTLIIGFLLIFIITTILWITIVSTPFRKNYGVSGLELAVHALGQFTEQNEKDVKGLEKFFTSFGTLYDIPVDLMCFRSKSPGKVKQKFKAILIVPGIHPGPFGYAGGSNLPEKLARGLKEYSDNVLVFHSASTHDYNPVRSEEVQKIVSSLKKALASQKLTYKSTGSEFVRVRSKDSVQICAQVIGPGILLAYTSSPKPTDDLDFEIGELAVKSAVTNSKLAQTAMFIDAHNSLEKGVDRVKFGSKQSREIQKLVTRSVSQLNNAGGRSRLRLGIAQSSKFSTKEGVGPLGIQVLVIETGGKKVAYILIDGNNMLPGLRKPIIKKIKGLVDEAEIFTTDNHVVNITMGGYNPIGLKCQPKRFVTTIHGLVKNAIENLENMEVSAQRIIVKKVNVFGKGNTVRLSRTINKTISLMGKSFAACNLLAIIGCILVYYFII